MKKQGKLHLLNLFVLLSMLLSLTTGPLSTTASAAPAQQSTEALVTLFTQDFEGAFPPAGWTVVNHGGNCVWSTTAVTGYTNYTGGGGIAADANADDCGSGTTMNTSLVSPAMNLSTASSATLTYRTYYNNLSSSESADVDVSINGGASWTNLLHWNTDHTTSGGELVTINLTPYVGNANVQVRFHYIAPGWDWYWMVDKLVATADIPPVLVQPGSQNNAACQGANVNYNLTITNNAGAAETYNLTVSGNNWPTTVLPTSVTLADGASTNVQVTVSIPNYAFDGDIDNATITATGVGDPGRTSSAAVHTTAGSKWFPVGINNLPAKWPAFTPVNGVGVLTYWDGLNAAGTPANQGQIFNGASWNSYPAHPGPGTFGGVAGSDGVTWVYYAPGFQAGWTALNTFYATDGGGTWQTLPARPQARGLGAGGMTASGKFIWVGGSPNSGFLPDTEVFIYSGGLAGTWTPGTTLMGVGFTAPGYAVVGEKLYVGGNYFGSNQFYVYDVTADTWTQLADLPAGAGKVSPLFINQGNDIYLVGGGTSPTTPQGSTWRYDITTDSWAPFASLVQPTMGSGGAFFNGKLYTYGGGAATAFNPARHEFTIPDCAAADTTTLVGTVMNGVTNLPIEGALVKAQGTGVPPPAPNGATSLWRQSTDAPILQGAGTTPSATTDANGHYELTLFEPAFYDVTASYGTYDPQTVNVLVSAANTTNTTQDFVLGPAVANPSPTSFTQTVPWGDQVSVNLDLANDGYSALNFQLAESDGGFIPAPLGQFEALSIPDKEAFVAAPAIHNGPIHPVTRKMTRYIYHAPNASPDAPAIIVYADDDVHTPTAEELALQQLGLSYTFYGNDASGANLSAFVADLDAGGWDFAILAADSWALVTPTDYTAMNNFFLAGGKGVAHSWAIGYDSAHSAHPLWATMGAAYASWVTAPSSMYWWDPANPLFNMPETVPQFTDLDNLGYLAYGAKMNPTTSLNAIGEALGGFAAAPASGQGGIIMRDDGKTIYKGLTDNLNSGDVDGDGKWDMKEWWVNAIQGIVFGFGGGDIPWLSEIPITGTVAAQAADTIAITFDASVVSEYGTYTGTLTLLSNDPAAPMIAMPVTMIVAANPNASTLQGTITSDRPGGPLAGATVDISNATPWTASATTDANGHYEFMIPPGEVGDFTVAVSKAGYLPDTQTVNVPAPGPVTHDVELVYNGSHITVNPLSFEHTVMWGDSATDVMTITNSGVANLTYNVDLAPMLFQDFEGSFPPAGWTIVTNGGCGDWDTTANSGRANFTGGSGYAAAADSDFCGSGMDTELWSPAFSLAGLTGANLIFNSDFNDFGNADDGYVDVSTDGGATWTNVFHYNKADFRGPRTETISLNAFAGSPNVIVRFHYVAPGWDWWWQVDNVRVLPTVSWLSWLPDSNTVIPGGSDPVGLTADSSLVPGPGDYVLSMIVNHNDGLTPPVIVPFTLHVTDNPNQGHLSGHVYGNRTPAGDNMPLEGATVHIFNMGYDFYATTDATGFYEFYLLPSQAGAYDMDITAPNYLPFGAMGVDVSTGSNTTLDATLILDSANLGANPEIINETLPWGGNVTVPVTITNLTPATQPLDVEITEVAGYYTPPVVQTVQVTLPALNANRAPVTTAQSFGVAKSHPALTRSVKLDKLALGKIKVLIVSSDWPAAGDIGGLDAVLNAYPDVQADIYPMDAIPTLGELLPYNIVVIGSQYTWESTFDHNALGDVFADYVDAGGKVIQLFGTMHGAPSGTYYWALGGRWQAENYSPMTYSTAYSLYQTRNLGVYLAGHPLMDGVTTLTDYFVYGNNVTFRPGAQGVAYYDNGVPYIGTYPGKIVAINQVLTNGADWAGDIPTLLHNAVLFLFGSDVPWLSETVTSFAAMPVDGLGNTNVTLDASVPEITQPGSYTAWLWLDNNDVLQTGAYIPVTMNVQADPNMGHLHGVITLNRHALGNNIPANGAKVILNGPSGAVQIITGPTGEYHQYYAAASLPATITVTAMYNGYQTVIGTVSLAAAQDLTHDVELELIAPWISVAPMSLEVTLLTDQQTTEQLTLDNFGLTDLEFRFLEFPPTATMPAAAGFSGMLAPVVVDRSEQQIDAQVNSQLAQNGKTDFWVRLRHSADLSSANLLPNKAARGTYVYNSMRSIADATQKGVLAYLKSRGLNYEAHWIVNSVLVYNASEADLRALAAMPEVVEIKGRFTATFSDGIMSGLQPYVANTAYSTVEAPVSMNIFDPLRNLFDLITGKNVIGPNAEINWSGTAWGISFINADQAWATYGFKGQGIVVANIDTGVQWDHPALINQFRGWNGSTADGNYNWFPPTPAAKGACTGAANLPCDWAGHGSHTMGTMVGDDGDPSPAGHRIGVAPEAKWIACMGCDTPPNNCSDAALTSCAEWMVAPTDLAGANPDASKAPDVINNSWGGGGGDNWYQSYVQAWVAAGMFPAFSIGNAGPTCGSAGSPGDYPESFASGMVNSSGVIDSGSSRGPGSFAGADIKPDIAAPGVAVCSSVPTDNYTCGYTGTSMASPHTAGAVALLWSASPVLRMDLNGTMDLLRMTANPNVPDAGNCGAPAGTNALVPNYTYGYGYLDVLAAMREAVVYDIPWLSETPDTGLVAPAGTQLVDVTFDATGMVAGTYTGTLRIMHNDPIIGNVDIPVTLNVVVYEPLLTPDTDAASGDPGTPVTYTLTLENNGSAADTFDLAYAGVWPGVLSSSTVGPLNPGEQATFTVRVNIPAAAYSGDFDVATVTATSQGDPARSDSSELTTTVGQQPILVQVTKTANAEQLPPGVDILYTIQVTNNSHDPITAVISDTIPANTVYKVGSVTGGLAFSDPPANVVTWSGQIAPGETKTFSFKVTTINTPPGTLVTNTVNVTVGLQTFSDSIDVLVDFYHLFFPLISRP